MMVLTSPCNISSFSQGLHRATPLVASVVGMEGNMEEQKEVLGPDSQEGFGNLSQNSFKDLWAAV